MDTSPRPQADTDMTSPHHTVLKELEGDSAWLVRVSRRLLQRADDAEDMVQEASVRALLSERSGRGVDAGRVRPWLVQTVKRLSWDANRREAVRTTTQLTDMAEGDTLDPAEAMERAEFRSTIAALVIGLPEAERQSIVLRYYEGLSTAEIMKVTGAPSQDAVRQRISRGIAKLRLQLDDDLGAREWRQSALAFCPTALKGTGVTRWVLAALVLAAGSAMSAMALWDDGEPLVPPAELAALEIAAIEPTKESSVAAPAQAEVERSAAAVKPTNDSDLAAAGPELLIQLTDASTGAPVADQPWFVLRTGEHDYGRAWGFASKEPNPKPIASGITGPDGMARFPLPDDELINLCTERSERFARGSWAVRIEDGAALPATCELFVGTTFRGRVVDDLGEPVAGLLLQTPSFTDEWLPLGTTDETGAFELPRCADFPRSFVIREDNKVEPSRTLPTDVTVMDGPVAVAYLSPMAGGVDSKTLSNTVISRGLRLRGTVVDAQRQPVKGALVSTYGPRVNLAKSAAKYDRQPLTLPWHDEGFELQEGEALTDASGHFALEVHPSRQRPTELDLVAQSPGGAMEMLSLTGLESGEERSGLRFELDSSDTVRLHLVPASLDDGPIRWDGNPDRAVTLIWDASKDPGAPRPLDRVTAISGPDVVLPHQHLPDRSLYGGRLVGTLDLPGYRAARISLDAGVHEATVPLEPVPKVHLRLDVVGAASEFLTGATVKVTPERPAESLTHEKNFHRGSSRSLIQTHAYGWQNNETLALDLRVGEQAYAYVMLFGGTARAQRALPPIGPIDLLSATAESPFVVRTRIDSWPERERRDRPSLKEGESAATVARRPTTILARLVDQDTGDLLEGAQAVSVDSAHRHYGSQRVLNGVELPMRLESSMEQLTLRFAATGYRSRVMGPLALSPGTEVDLGTIALEPLQKIQCRLLRSDGSPTTGVHVLSWTDREAGWTRVKSSKEGVAVLFAGDSLPEWIKVKAREGGNDPEQLLKPVRTGPHACTLEVPEWRKVRLRVEGVSVPWCYGVERIRVVGLSPALGVDPITSTLWWPRFDGDALVFDTRLPPGKWTVKPSTPEFVTFPDTSIWIDGGAAPGAERGVNSEAAPAELTVQGTITVR